MMRAGREKVRDRRRRCRSPIVITTLCWLTLGLAANGAEVNAPRLPDPQWHAYPGAPFPDHGSSSDAPSPAASSAVLALPTLPAATFEGRCMQPGVVLCDPLDDGRVAGVGINGKTANATLPEALKGHYRDWRWCDHVAGVTPETPTMDTEVKASGSGSLKFTTPTRSAANAGGYCQIDFTPDNSVQFGEGDTFFVQFKVRLSCTLLFTDCNPASAGYKKQRRAYRAMNGGVTSFKVSIINDGDHPRLPYPVNSCTAQHLVLVQGPAGIVAGYHSCGPYDPHEIAVGQERGSVLWDRQPKRGRAGAAPCLIRGLEASPGCMLWPADEWVTITQQVTIGKWASALNDPARGSTVRVWMQREGQAPVLVIDYNRNLLVPEEPFMKYGKIWLLPYMTDKDPLEDHAEAYMWFDELIVSTQPIAPAL